MNKKMNKTRNIIIAIFLLVIAFLIAIFYWQGKNIGHSIKDVKIKDINLEQVQPQAIEKPFISKGDKLGGMTVMGVEPFNSGQYSKDPAMMKLGPKNAKIILKGPIVVTGTYELVISEIGFSGYCMTGFDEISISQIPSLLKEGKPKASLFCFRDKDEKFITSKLGDGKQSHQVTIKIDNYELNSYPSEVTDRSDLVEVISP
jgi:hypothetical protein